MPYELAKEILLNDKISFVTNRQVSPALKLKLQPTEVNFEKLLG